MTATLRLDLNLQVQLQTHCDSVSSRCLLTVRDLRLDDNKLTGAFPAVIGKLTKLR